MQSLQLPSRPGYVSYNAGCDFSISTLTRHIRGGVEAMYKVVKHMKVGFARCLRNDTRLLKQIVVDVGSKHLNSKDDVDVAR